MILPGQNEPVMIQGITGNSGSIHTELMLRYGTKIAAGVTPGKGGQSVHGVPVYNTVAEAKARSGAMISVLFVPAPSFLAAAEEAIVAGVKLLVAITEHIPIRDTLRILALARANGTTVIGPNTPGIILPRERVKLGIMPANSYKDGRIALISRSGTLMYEVANELSRAGLGQRVAVGVGGDPINCTTMIESFDECLQRGDVRSFVVVGEIGGDTEERLAHHITEKQIKARVVAYIAGRHAPKEKRMGHAGAIIYGDYGTADSKIRALTEAGASVAQTPMEIPVLVAGKATN
jgi:succinyl-CoA synthetase alpha subunit